MWNILQGYLEFQLWCFQQNFVCLDNLTVTLLCLLVSLLCHCYLAPCPFYSLGLFNIRTLYSDWIFISKHKHNHSPYWYIFLNIFSLEIHYKISEWVLSTYYCAASPVNCHLCYFLLKMFFLFVLFLFFCVHASWDLYMWGKRDETVEIVLWRAFLCWCACQHYYCCCEMLDQRSNHDKLTVNCQ